MAVRLVIRVALRKERIPNSEMVGCDLMEVKTPPGLSPGWGINIRVLSPG